MRKTSSALNTESTSVVELPAGRQVVAERLLDDDPPPAGPACVSAMPVRCICLSTVGNIAGGIDR